MPKTLPDNTLNYRLNCGDYVLHRGDTPIGPLLPEVAIAYSESIALLHKHGAPDSVKAWAAATAGSLRRAGAPELADDIKVISGRLPLEDVNRCLTTSGYLALVLKRLQSGLLLAEPLDFGSPR